MKALSIENNLWAPAWKAEEVGPAGWLAVSGAGRQGWIHPSEREPEATLVHSSLPGSWGHGDQVSGHQPGAFFPGKQWDPSLAQHRKLIRQFIACHFSLPLVVSSKNKVTFLVYLCIRQINAAILLPPGMEGCAALQTLMLWQMSLNKDWKMLARHGILHLLFFLTVKVASE